MIASAREAAERAIARNKEIRLTAAEEKRFARAILNPPAVAHALRKAMKYRDRLLDQS